MPFTVKGLYEKVSALAEVIKKLNEEPLIGARRIVVDLPADSAPHRYPHQLGRTFNGAWPGGFADAISCTPPDPGNEQDRETVEIRNLTGIAIKQFPVLVI
jgi:hypothetical protein